MNVSAISTVSSHMVDFFILSNLCYLVCLIHPFGNFNNWRTG